MSGKKVLVIGLGQIGMGYDIELDPEQHIYSHARAFDRHPGFSLVGGVDPDPVRRAKFSKSFRVPAYKAHEVALAKLAPELVIIAAPTFLHSTILESILKYGSVKTILCEKPLSYSADESLRMINACNGKNVQLLVNYMRRSDPAVIEIKRRLGSGEIQGPVKGVVWYGGGLIHNGSHFFNLLEYWLGKMRDYRVVGAGVALNNGDADVDVSVRFESGIVLFLSTDDRDFAHYEVELIAYNGRLRYERAGHRVTWQGVEQNPIFSNSLSIASERKLIDSGMNVFQYNVASQVEALLAGQISHLSKGEEAVRTVEALSRIIGEI